MPDKNTAYVTPTIAGILSLFDPALDWSADLSGDEYATALKEYLVVNQEGSLDPRRDDELDGDTLAMIKEEFNKVRKNKDLEYSVKKTTGAKINAASMKNTGAVGTAQKVAADTTGASAIQKWKPPSGVSDATKDVEQASPQASPISEGLLAAVQSIDESVGGILQILGDSNKIEEDAIEDARIAGEEAQGKKAETGLEKVLNVVKGAAEKVIAPVKSIFSSIFGFIKTIFMGRIGIRIFEWFSDPSNLEKVTAIFRFLKDWWPVLLAGIMAFMPALLGPGGFILGTIALLAWGIPKIINAVKSIFGLGKNVDKELDVADKDADKDLKKQIKGLEAEVDKETGQLDTKTKPKELDKTPTPQQSTPKEQEPQKMAKGGEVPGKGEGDTVPAMLTPGEFVLTKDAVNKFGVDTLEGMNAAAARGGGSGGGTTAGAKGSSVGGKPNASGSGDRHRYGDPTGKEGFANISNTMTMEKGEWSRDKQGNETSSWSSGVRYISTDEAKEFLKERGFPSMQLMDGSVVPNFGKMVEREVRPALQATKEIAIRNQASPEVIAQIDQLMADPHMQPGVVASIINEIVPGSWDHSLAEESEKINQDFSGLKMSSGGIVPPISRPSIARRAAFMASTLLPSSIKAAAGLDKGPAIEKSAANISKIQSSRVVPGPPPKKISSVEAVQQVADLAQAPPQSQTTQLDAAPGIPPFEAGAMQSRSKIRILGVTV